MKKIQTNLALSVGAFVLCLAPYQPALADMMGGGERSVPVSYCSRIENLEKHPDYLFIAFPASQDTSVPTHHAILKPNECFIPISRYGAITRYGGISRLYALPKSAVKQADIIVTHRGEEGKEIFLQMYAVPKSAVKEGEIIVTLKEENLPQLKLPQIKDLEEKDKRLIPSNFVIEHWGSMPRSKAPSIASAGSRHIVKNYDIISLNPKQLELKEQRIIDNKPQLSILGLSLGGLVATGIIIFRRRKHPK